MLNIQYIQHQYRSNCSGAQPGKCFYFSTSTLLCTVNMPHDITPLQVLLLYIEVIFAKGSRTFRGSNRYCGTCLMPLKGTCIFRLHRHIVTYHLHYLPDLDLRSLFLLEMKLKNVGIRDPLKISIKKWINRQITLYLWAKSQNLVIVPHIS